MIYFQHIFSKDRKEGHSISVLIIFDEEDTIRDFKVQRPNSKENIAQKVNLRPFSPYSDYSYPLTLSNVGESYRSSISRSHIQAHKEKHNFVVACLRPCLRKIRHFHRVVVQKREKNVPKSARYVQSCCFAL